MATSNQTPNTTSTGSQIREVVGTNLPYHAGQLVNQAIRLCVLCVIWLGEKAKSADSWILGKIKQTDSRYNTPTTDELRKAWLEEAR